MGSKAKICLSIASIFIIAVIAAVVVVAVFAVGKQTVNSSINVTYTAVQVHGSAKAYVHLGDSNMPMITDGGDEEIIFNATDENTPKTLKPSEQTITLTDEIDFVVFEYILKNDEQKPYTATLTYQDTGDADTGIDVFVTTSSSMISRPTIDNVTTAVEDMGGTIVEDEVKGELYVYVLFQLNGASEAGFSGRFTWTLSGV